MWKSITLCPRAFAASRQITSTFIGKTCVRTGYTGSPCFASRTKQLSVRRAAYTTPSIARAFSTGCILRVDDNIARERRRQQAQDDEREDIAEHSRRYTEEGSEEGSNKLQNREQDTLETSADKLAPEIERLDPQQVPDLYPEFEVNEQDEETEGDDSWYVDPAFTHEEEVSVGDIPLWQRRAAENLGRPKIDVSEFAQGSLFDMCCSILQMDAEVKVVDVAEKCEWTSRMVMSEAKSTRHMRAMAETLLRAIKDRNRQKGNERVIRVDGRESDDWMIVDLGNFVVHIMTPEARETYDLETLWTASPQTIKEVDDA
ncbi:hypothetical protein GGI25_004520 [Coemansia spiralis]|uniref:Ribosomal silencing factor RsfS n=2 Tax=Coemansia TaxID=4863 RepID=A0A9W8G4M9_9FUNG|nr:Oligomerization domain-containing protein [Coemansia spiralis]KAJ1990164.1 hypothetical protein EDC05_004220 [Coemansia umbellata]KAJ2620690.1 hypothetical protein GGI26_004768 [Coemansia sp. RSA 1358]KAJ2673953.1 hypothetical protein GGI25_004520 [Coemansia spiralis]